MISHSYEEITKKEIYEVTNNMQKLIRDVSVG